jgi:hypothetical protein
MILDLSVLDGVRCLIGDDMVQLWPDQYVQVDCPGPESIRLIPIVLDMSQESWKGQKSLLEDSMLLRAFSIHSNRSRVKWKARGAFRR